MKLLGRRILIAGSASPETQERDLVYAHDLVSKLTGALAAKGASFVVSLGAEPRRQGHQDGPSIIFDWTVAEHLQIAIASHNAQVTGPSGRLIATIVTENTSSKIPQTRHELYDALRSADAVSMSFLDPGWGSGAVRRQRQAQLGDILLAISGGEGVEHLAQEFASLGKQVIPVDLNLGASCSDGSGGGAKLFREALKDPRRFFTVKSGQSGAELLDRCRTNTFAFPPGDVASTILHLIDELDPPRAFYVRLLNKDLPEYASVEDFFRSVVDPMVEDLGLEMKQMGLGVNEYAWMNQAIFDSLHHSHVAIVDITGLRPNCFMELGYALGHSQRVIVTARKGTPPPFDSSCLETHFWDPEIELEERRKEFREHWARNFNMPPIVRPRGLR
jgi:hypothetical protein